MNDPSSPMTPMPGHRLEEEPEPAWKQALRGQFEDWLNRLDGPPSASSLPLEDEIPDLTTFYSGLTALGTEFRKSNRRTAEAMKQWSELMTGFQSEIVRLGDRLDSTRNEPPPTTHWMDLVDFADRLDRVNIAFQTTPKEAWFGRDKSWRAAWQQQSQAFGILLVHQRTLLGRAEISRVETKGQIFDSEFMTVVATEPSGDLPPETVISEIRPGYRRHGQVLRLAEVSVSVEPIQKLTQ
jgi:hypothetical protein